MSIKFPKILVVDDSRAFRVFVRESIRASIKDARIFECDNGYDAIVLFKKHTPDLVLLDINMPKLDGKETLKYIIKINPNAKIIVTTAYGDDQTIINQLMHFGASKFVSKPMNRMILMKSVTDILSSTKVAGTHNQILKSIVLDNH